MSEIVIAGKGISKVFYKDGQSIPVLAGVDIEVHQGELVAINGSSGAGKSTLLHILGTLEPPTQGQVLFGSNQQNLFDLNDSEIAQFRNRALGFIFQFHYLLPEFSALENVMMPALIAGYSRGASEKQARELLDFVGLSHRMDHRPSELSGGEQQRVAVARAVILRPKLILADEPTGNLNSAQGEEIMELFKKLNEEGVTIIQVTHSEKNAEYGSRIISLLDGKNLSN